MRRRGNINPVLYRLAGTTPSAFHDVTTGGNQVACRVAVSIAVQRQQSDTPPVLVTISPADLARSMHFNCLLHGCRAQPPSGAGKSDDSIDSDANKRGRPQPISDVEQGGIRSGYVVITPDAQSVVPSPMVTFGIVKSGVVQSQAGVLPASSTTAASLLLDLNTSIGRNLAFAS
jgi:hypothetical protein